MNALRSLSAAIVLGGLALAPAALALEPGALYAVSGAPGGSTFLPGVGNDAWLGADAHSTTYLATSNSHKVSDNGRYVTFTSKADGLFGGDDDRYTHVYRQDRDSGAVALVDAAGPGGSGDGDARDPAISGDGTRVVFATDARLVTQDTDDQSDVYVRDLVAGTTTLMSTGPGGPGTGSAADPDISRDGTKVAFAATQPFLAPDADTLADVYTAVVATGALQIVSRANGVAGALPNQSADNPSISASGNAVAWVTEATNVDGADTDSKSDVYLRAGNTTLLISRANGLGGAKGDNSSGDPAIAPDGSAVAFTSYSSNLDPAAPGGRWAVFLRTTTGVTSLVSRATGAAGAAADDMAWGPSISLTGAGMAIAFATSAKNLSGATSASNHAFVRSLATDTTTLVSRLDGAAGDRVTVFGAPSIAAAGTAVAFGSDDDAVTTGDDNRFSSVYVREGTTTTWRSRPLAGDLHGGSADADLQSTRTVSADGTRVLFATGADGLFPGDAPGGRYGVFVRDLRTGDVILASRGDGADGPAAAVAYGAQISADGTKVMFATDEPIGFGTPANVSQVYVRDLATGHTTLASAAGGTPVGSDANAQGFSADGRYVLFTTTSPLFGVVSPTDQLYRKDLATGEVVLVSRDPGTGNPLTSVSEAAISGDGSRVAFTTGDKLVPGDTDANYSVYVRDMAGDAMTLASHAPDGKGNDDAAYGPQISDDGMRVSFLTGSKNLDPADTDTGATDGYVADLSAGTVSLVTGSPSDSAFVVGFVLSGDGRRAGWATNEALVADDTDTLPDAYVHDLAGGPVTLAGRDGNGAPLAGRVDKIALSGNGGCLAAGVSGATGYGYPPVPSPHVPGTEPSPDFRYVVLRALDDSCVRPVPPVGAPPKGGTTTPPPVDRVKPVVSRASLTNTTFRRSAASTAISAAARKRARLGTTLRFTLSETSTVTVRFEQRTTGRKVGRTCRKATRKLRRRKACTRSVKRGMLTRKALKAGANRIAFTGRLGRKALPLGRYRATVVATDAAGNRSTPKLLAFRIVRR